MKEFEHGGNVYGEISKDAGFDRWLDFSANINPLGLADSVRQSMIDGVDKVVNYPDPAAKSLKQAISEYYDVPAANVVLGNGAVELLYLYVKVIEAKVVQIPVPSFSEYERAARSVTADVRYLYLDEGQEFAIDCDRLLEDMPGADVLMLCNPNNPTGKLIFRQDMERIVAAAEKHGVNVIVDESFMDFRTDADRYSVMSLTGKYSNLMGLQSLTKFYAIPGLRLGFAVCNETLVQKIEQHKDPWNVNLLAQAAGVAGLNDVAYQKQSRQVVSENMLELAASLGELSGVKVYSPAVNFILLNIRETGIDSGELTARMRKYGILIRDCSNYPGLDGNYVRVAVKGKDDNRRLVETMKRCIP